MGDYQRGVFAVMPFITRRAEQPAHTSPAVDLFAVLAMIHDERCPLETYQASPVLGVN
jgi:hypothetical protein